MTVNLTESAQTPPSTYSDSPSPTILPIPMTPRTIRLKIEQLEGQLQTACILEAAAAKPGNVHRTAAFKDLTFEDFEKAAAVTGQELSSVAEAGVGQAILNATTLTQQTLQTNANLGILLLLAPLAVVPAAVSLKDGINLVIGSIDVDETKLIYEAIRIAQPGGMGEVKDQDVSETPDQTIRQVMQLAVDRDSIAKQYCNGFEDILDFGRKRFLIWSEKLSNWELAIIGTHLELMVRLPDSLIQRKCSREVAIEASQRAKHVLDLDWPNSQSGKEAFVDLDRWLRADQNRRNPGTTADLIAAVLFSLIRDRQWTPPESIEI